MATKKSSAKSSVKPQGKIFDIARSNKTAPPASAKPIIVTNRPLLQDPMVVVPADGPADQTSDGSAAAAAPTITKIKIAPIHSADELTGAKTAQPSDDQTEPAAAKDDAASEKPAPEEAVALPNSDPEQGEKSSQPQQSEKSEPEDKPANMQGDKSSDETPADQAVANQDQETADKADKASASTDSNQTDPDQTGETKTGKTAAAADGETKTTPAPAVDEAAARQASEHAAEVNKLVESRQYYLPINQVEKRRNKRAALLGVVLIIILCLAWVDIALDAGIIKLGGLHAITHFFSK